VLPGTSSPEPDGLTYAALVALVRGAARRNTVVGADVVEFLPSPTRAATPRCSSRGS
jgi:agmatinase